MWRNLMARLAIVDIRLNHARGLDGSEPRPRSNLPENAGACSNTASLFDGILTATLGFVLVADPSEDVAPKNFGAGWMPAAAASRRMPGAPRFRVVLVAGV